MIESVWIGDAAGHSNADVIVKLQDGRTYAFTAFTPAALQRLMEEDGSSYFLCDDMLVVREITPDNIRAALDEMLKSHDIERYGIRQRA